MSTNITITSDDVVKAKALGETIAQVLEEKGFMNLTATFQPPFQQPMGSGIHRSRSALEAIQDLYPSFLEEQINIRAIPVIGVEKKYHDNRGNEVAVVHVDNLSQNFASVDTIIVFNETFDDGEITPPKTPRNMDKVMERAFDNLKKNEDYQSRPNYTQAAWQLESEGVIDNKQEVTDMFIEWERREWTRGVVGTVHQRTGYGDPPISEEVKALIEDN